MCGFFVVLSKSQVYLTSEYKVKISTKLLHHRGPDSEGYFFKKIL